jgi:dipeptidyl-peptidase-4
MRSSSRLFILVLSVLSATPFAFSQNQELTLQDAVLNRFSSLYPTRLPQLQWIKGKDAMSYTKGDSIMIQNAEDGSLDVAMTLQQINALIPFGVGLKALPAITWINDHEFEFRSAASIFRVNVTAKQLTNPFKLPEQCEEVTFNNDHSACAYVENDNLFIQSAFGESIQISQDGGSGIVYGKAVHRNEFGINSGIFWSPDGRSIAFYRMDERMVERYPLVEINSVPATVRSIPYPMAGRASHHVTLGIYQASSKKLTYVKTGEPADQYLCSITWSPDNDALYIAVLNRDQNHLKLNRYWARDGKLDQTLFEEQNSKYVEPEHPLWFVPGTNDQFIWMSERDGFDHLYLYQTSGKLLRPLTTGHWEVERIIGMDDTRNYLFVEGTGEVITANRQYDDQHNALHRFTYVVDVELGGKTIVDDRKGTHHAVLSDDGRYLYEHFTSITVPWETNLFTAMGKKVMNLHTSPDPMASYEMATVELGHIVGGGNGDRLYTRLIKPSDFNPNQSYPVLVYVYGGPHAQLIQDSYLAAAPLWMYWMAQQGYIVATVDNRGSANRGLAFEQATFRNLGTEEMTDQKMFVDYLTSLPYVDKSRMAIHGWSYGGFMTINMMLTFPGMFKAGVAGGPVCDWSMYEVMYTERYMDTPEQNPDGYQGANLSSKVTALEDDLMLIHGTVDDVVLWQHSQAFVKAAIDNNEQLDYFIYPGHPHNVRGKDRYHLMEKVLNYIDERIGEP